MATMSHLVDAVRFTSGEEGKVTCTCGAVTSVAGFPLHRKQAGAPFRDRHPKDRRQQPLSIKEKRGV